jgi:hypothetical protein
MHARRSAAVAVVLLGTTGCGATAVEQQSRSALAAANVCMARLHGRLHLPQPSKGIDEGFVHDLGGGRLRLTGSVPPGKGLTHGASYTCVVAAGLTGLRITSFQVRRATSS